MQDECRLPASDGAPVVPDVVLATSSSGLTPSAVQDACRHPGRVVLGHPFNPPHLMPLVEVVPAPQPYEAPAELLGDRADQVQRFYLPGRLNYSELTTAHLGVMRGIIGALKLKPRKSENERSMIAMYKKDTDRVDLSRLDEIVAWAEAAKGAQNN